MMICLTGMHRSGTSLFSSYLERCGIPMGEKMVGAARGNLRGHFEDLDFVELHGRILAHNHCHMYSPKLPLEVTAEHRDAASRLLAGREREFPAWGWKDPRSSLFLRFWHDLAPDIRFILIYRHPDAVADSLVRRGTDRRLMVMPWLPYQAWLSYNTQLLEFYKQYPDKCILLNIQGVNRHHDRVERLISSFLAIDNPARYSSVYNPKELSSGNAGNPSIIHRALSRYFSAKMHALYTELEQAASIPGEPSS